MININDFKIMVRDILKRDLDENKAQWDVVSHEGNDVLMVVAGPGSGKSTVLVLRALRHVLVDDILPEQLIITTFTRKAAKELRTRWIDWSTLLINSLKNNSNIRESLIKIDLNRCRIETLDSIAQQAITENRLPGEIAPILLESSASKIILKRVAFSRIYESNKIMLDQFFARYTFNGEVPQNRGEALSIAKLLNERLIQDRVDLDSFCQVSPTHLNVVNILKEYMNKLHESNLFDFSALEHEFLHRIQNGYLQSWINEIRALLIDEYQDTNPLQESIYFEIIKKSFPLVTIVGDDDQSMYRFRGGSVELFTQFGNRCVIATGRKRKRIDMVTNYRSSNEIVTFYNSYILGDPAFASARIIPAKPEVSSKKGTVGMPIIGMFRQSPAELADSLASWLKNLFDSNNDIRRSIISNGIDRFELNLSREANLGDCVLLAHSIEEIKYDRYNANYEPRFTNHFRNAMLQRGLQVFNPRGRSLRTITSVQQILGLLLLCLDPDKNRTNSVFPTNESKFFLDEWRQKALTFMNNNPYPSDSGGLASFVKRWQSVSRGEPKGVFPSDWPVLELIYKLITWIPDFQNDPEHQVWLETITRTVSNAGMASPYNMQIYMENIHRERSRESFIRDALIPIAENEVEVDEDIIPSVPRNRIQIMTIHQSKGLEFPLAIIDVGSHYTGNWLKQRFLRFPEKPSNVVKMEDDIEAHISMPLRSYRSPIDRTFDDLMRLYYVAFSRPESVLILIGCEKCLSYGRGSSLKQGVIPNIALGWNRNGTWPWRQPFFGRPPIRVNPPMILI